MEIIDASDCIAGRLAANIAKMLLKGETVSIINAEKAVISGDPKHVLEEYREKLMRGDPYHGPFYPRRADMMLKRIIRGMLPIKKPTGKEALKRLKVYISVPNELKDKEIRKIKSAENKLECKSITLDNLGKKLGAKHA